MIKFFIKMFLGSLIIFNLRLFIIFYFELFFFFYFGFGFYMVGWWSFGSFFDIMLV